MGLGGVTPIGGILGGEFEHRRHPPEHKVESRERETPLAGLRLQKDLVERGEIPSTELSDPHTSERSAPRLEISPQPSAVGRGGAFS
jgi:hypothetical protein